MTQPSQPSDPQRPTDPRHAGSEPVRSGRRPRPTVVVGVLLLVMLLLAVAAFLGMRSYLAAGAAPGTGAEEPAVAAAVGPSPGP